MASLHQRHREAEACWSKSEFKSSVSQVRCKGVLNGMAARTVLTAWILDVPSCSACVVEFHSSVKDISYFAFR